MDQSLASSAVSLSGTKDMGSECLIDTVTSELYRLACRIYLRKILDPSISDDDQAILALLVEFIDALELLPSDSPSNNILSWPLVVTGLCATRSAHQRIISTKLAHIHGEWRSEIFSKGAAFLREKWRNDRNTNYRLSSTILPRTTSINDIPSWDQLIWYKLPVILA
ncbi:hypothetical protein AbraIFM66951_007065 [Aspergillus brasiliensis]|nr:hypothetical protein AbraIFM66951_007065 [Aspergillus brasiliensis]